jgi:predicted MFS family arabinose efflux permease
VRLGPLRWIPRLLGDDEAPRTIGLIQFARAHATSAAADAFVTVSLAGSLFFSVSPDASRRQVLLYLVVTMAPFAVIAPLVGPTIDRFRTGHRIVAIVLYLLRAALAVALAFALFDLTFYFLALALLVANKASGVLRQAIVPGLVDDELRLISANSYLARWSTVVGGLGGATGAALATVAGSRAPLWGAAGLFVLAAVFASRIPRRAAEQVAEAADQADEFDDAHRPLVAMSAAAYTVIRGVVGAFVFGLAFALRRTNEPAWMYGAALVAYGAGAYAGNVIAPLARRRFGEDKLLAGALGGLAIAAAFAAAGASRALVIVVAAVMGMATTIGRQGFDGLVQRTAPRAMHGRAFARFETRFQLGWVLGGAIAAAAAAPTTIGLTVVAAVLIPAAVMYLRAARQALRYDTAASIALDHLDTLLLAAERHATTGDPRRAAVELTTVVDLARLRGHDVDAALVHRVETLRRCALEGTLPDTEECQLAPVVAALREELAATPVSPTGREPRSSTPPSTSDPAT